jgi:hypothetical protein
MTEPVSDFALRGRIGAYARWARTQDRRAATKPAHDAFMARFEREVDPDGRLDPVERARRAQFAMRAYMATLSRRRVLTRRRKRSAVAPAVADEASHG